MKTFLNIQIDRRQAAVVGIHPQGDSMPLSNVKNELLLN